MKQCLKTLMERLPEGVDGALITSDENRRYFTNMKSSAGTLLVTREKAQFIIDFRYIEKARSVITDFEVLLQSTDFYGQIQEFFSSCGAKTIAVEAETLTLSQYNRYLEKLPELAWVNDVRLSEQINKLRATKTADEIADIQKAQSFTDAAFDHILGFIKPGVTEKEIALELEYTMRRLGATGIAFDTIAVSGVNSSLPHGVPSDKKVETGDFVTMDFGASYNGYCSDMTRTVAVGAVSDEQKKVYDTVLEAHLMAKEAIEVGKLYCEIDQVARDHIYKNGYEGCFGHSLGHSLGLLIHEMPGFSQICKEVITPNVIVTVEPGIYLNGKFGVRIEDMVLIGEKTAESLTKSEKKLITL